MDKAFRFELGQKVRISASGEEGQVIGRAEYLDAQNQYWCLYKAADGRAVQSWWYESALEAA